MNHCIEAVLTYTVNMLNPADSHKTVVVDTQTLHHKAQKQLQDLLDDNVMLTWYVLRPVEAIQKV